jgi:hypothetical protein
MRMRVDEARRDYHPLGVNRAVSTKGFAAAGPT